MGNTLRFLYRNCCEPTTQELNQYQYGGVPPTTISGGVSALAHDLNQYQITSQVPGGLSELVVSSRKAQAKWYTKLLQTWKEAKPAPRTPEQASKIVIRTLKHHQKADVEGLLKYYGLPLPHSLVDAKDIPDGDTLTVYVSAKDRREAPNVPKAVHVAVSQRTKASASKDYQKADVLHKNIIDAGYRVLTGSNNKDILAKKYRIRLSGIDCPESKQHYGQEAKQELIKLVQGKCLLINVYAEDRYGRLVGDIHCNGKFIQEIMLKKGFAWHYAAYDKRPELIKWENAARAKRVGLWASPNPEKPWEWRKKKHDGN